MNIFELDEQEIKEVLQNKLNEITPEELLKQLIECGLNENVTINGEATYSVMSDKNNNICNLWVHKESSGWTSWIKKFNKKDDLKEAV